MATGKASDFTIYQAEFNSGISEVNAQNVNVFGAASNQCIQIKTAAHKGEYDSQSFFDQMATAVTRRDNTSVAAVTDLAITQDEFIGVKLDRKFGPVGQTLDAFRKQFPDSPTSSLEDSMRYFSFQLGKQLQSERLTDMVNSAFIAVEAAIDGVAALNYDATGGTLAHTDLNEGLALFGDQAQNIKCWAMHSAPWFDLAGNSIGSSGFDGIASAMIKDGVGATLGRPVVVSDSSGLTSGSGSTLKYQTLGLVPGAVIVEESEPIALVSEPVTGLETIVLRMQAEWSFTIKVKGFKWDITNGAANPTAATLGTVTNWDKAATQDKMLAGVHIEADAT